MKSIGNSVIKDGRKIIVLDDDPTGTQTVYDLPIFTRVNHSIIMEAFQDKENVAFYILTNTRAMSEEDAEKTNSEIAKIIDLVSKETNIDYEIISRGDSTLRGHFPLELDVIKNNISKKIDGYILMPFFKEGNRITMEDIHYIRENDKLIPVSETQFAKDHTFGFNSSNLRDYVVEKSEGKISRDNITSISIDELRSNSPSVFNKLLELNGDTCIVNAENYKDVQAFVIELIKAEQEGKSYLLRTAASYVKTRIGLEDRDLLNGHLLEIPNNKGGVVVAGSYVDKTTEQINHLLKETEIESIELDVSTIVKESDNNKLVENISKKLDANILKGIDTIIYTSRKIALGNDDISNLEVGNRISKCLADMIKNLEETPAFIIAKGGITSNDIATKGLNIEKAMVCGQIANGVPVWRSGPESKFNALTYVVFPGNVGDAEELTNVVGRLRKK